MVVFPPCKINLGLSVKYKRTDSYHELETIMFQIPWCDILEIIPSETFSFTYTGLEISGNSDSNLCVKAYQLLKHNFDIPAVKIHLHKILPMGAGLGGGSSNGTYTLLALNELFDLKISKSDLIQYSLQLGSDCPLFVNSSTQLAKGRGEILSEFDLNLKGYYLHLVNLGIHVSTKDAFSNISFSTNNFDYQQVSVNNISEWKNFLKNDFEYTVFKIYPILNKLKSKLYENGAIYASMSGSGSTIFGIYDKIPSNLVFDDAEICFEKILEII